jgi:hypothetical protein
MKEIAHISYIYTYMRHALLHSLRILLQCLTPHFKKNVFLQKGGEGYEIPMDRKT